MKNLIKFVKMQALGNDFVLLDRVTQNIPLTADTIRYIANRQLGIGCDQVLVAEPPIQPNSDFFYRIFNADGSQVGQCGNGARCFAQFVRDIGLTDKRKLLLDTNSGNYSTYIKDINSVIVNMGTAKFTPEDLPCTLQLDQHGNYSIYFKDLLLNMQLVSIGNPHCILDIDELNINQHSLSKIANFLQQHSVFPNGINVNFVKIISNTHIQLRTFERGAGETMSCGSGASATAAALMKFGKISNIVRVETKGGDLKIKLSDKNNCLYLKGPVTRVFSGHFLL